MLLVVLEEVYPEGGAVPIPLHEVALGTAVVALEGCLMVLSRCWRGSIEALGGDFKLLLSLLVLVMGGRSSKHEPFKLLFY